MFYPGAKVEETAYAPFLRRLAAEGVDVFLLRVPFRLAFFSTERAADVMARFDYAHWYVGGHSLGGAVAALFAASHGAELDGLILCAEVLVELDGADLDDLPAEMDREFIEYGGFGAHGLIPLQVHHDIVHTVKFLFSDLRLGIISQLSPACTTFFRFRKIIFALWPLIWYNDSENEVIEPWMV